VVARRWHAEVWYMCQDWAGLRLALESYGCEREWGYKLAAAVQTTAVLLPERPLSVSERTLLVVKSLLFARFSSKSKKQGHHRRERHSEDVR